MTTYLEALVAVYLAPGASEEVRSLTAKEIAKAVLPFEARNPIVSTSEIREFYWNCKENKLATIKFVKESTGMNLLSAKCYVEGSISHHFNTLRNPE